jgi:hypothetical protein
MTLLRFFTATLLIAVGSLILGFLGHQLLLGHDYVSIEPIMRSSADMQAHMPFAVINYVAFAAAFVWIYSHTNHVKHWFLEGLQFGVAVWAVRSVPLYLTNYVIHPWPALLVAKTLAWELIATIVLGFIVVVICKRS